MLKTILYTRENSCPEAIRQVFLEKDIEVCHLPLIQTVPMPYRFPEKDVDWIFFTSGNTVKYLNKKRDFTCYKIASIGPKTSDMLMQQGIHVDFEPSEAVAECLLSEWLDLHEPLEQHLFLPSSKQARAVLKNGLIEKGYQVSDCPIYQTVFPEASEKQLRDVFDSNKIKDAMFASPSTWHHFKQVANDKQVQLKDWRLYSIGPITTRAIEESGERVFRQANVYDMDHLVEQVLREM